MRTLVLILLVTAALPLVAPTAEAYACALDVKDPDAYVTCEVNRATRCLENTLEGRPWCPA